ALARLEEIGNIHAVTQQERDQLTQEKDTLQSRLHDTQSALEDCKEYIATLQKKAREDKRNRAKAAIELSQNIALERENLVRQLDSLSRLVNRKLLDDREERNHRRVSGTVQSTSIIREGETIPLPLTHPEEPGKDRMVTCRITHDHGLVCEAEFGKTDSRSMGSTGISKARRGSIMAAYFGPVVFTKFVAKLSRRAQTEKAHVRRVTHPQGHNRYDTSGKQLKYYYALPVLLFSNSLSRRGSSENDLTGIMEGVESDNEEVFKTVRWSSVQGPFGSMDEAKVETVLPGLAAVDQLSFRSDDGAVSVHYSILLLPNYRFRGLTRQYYRRADAVILVYDVTNIQSFLSVRKWVQEVRDNTDEYTVLMILSNKIDLLPEVSSDQYPTKNDLDALCTENGAIGFEVSAALGQNIELAFNDLTK
ncbi:hypothetical protein T265_14753, partial [Opisthorchis viverrini]